MEEFEKLSKKDQKLVNQYFLDETRELKVTRKYITQETIDQIKKIDKKDESYDFFLEVNLHEIMVAGMRSERAYNERKQKRINKQNKIKNK